MKASPFDDENMEKIRQCSFEQTHLTTKFIVIIIVVKEIEIIHHKIKKKNTGNS